MIAWKSVGVWLGTLVRVALGLWVSWLGLVKAFDPVTFLKAVRQYGLLETPWLLNAVAILLPWLEVFCGLLLLAGVAVRGTAWLLGLLLAGFTVLVAVHGWQLAEAHQMALCAVKFDCGCGTGEVRLCHKVAENLLMLAGCIWLGTGRVARSGALRFELIVRGTDPA
ncbi:MAG: hypothetical protein KatS3mg132_657 [Limisphaera sp.]|nr:MAG: hypothetical protein KatS3mg132_657 [Limisphaera sp.]